MCALYIMHLDESWSPPATHTPTPTLLFPFLIWCNAGFFTWRRYIPCICAQLNKEPHGPEWRWATSNVTGGTCGRETRNVGSWVHLERSQTCLGDRRRHRRLAISRSESSFDWRGSSLASSVKQRTSNLEEHWGSISSPQISPIRLSNLL